MRKKRLSQLAWHVHICLFASVYVCACAIAFVHLTSLDFVIYPWNAETAAFHVARCDMCATRALAARRLKWHGGGIKCHASECICCMRHDV